jgi:hypothetical protein
MTPDFSCLRNGLILITYSQCIATCGIDLIYKTCFKQFLETNIFSMKLTTERIADFKASHHTDWSGGDAVDVPLDAVCPNRLSVFFLSLQENAGNVPMQGHYSLLPEEMAL